MRAALEWQKEPSGFLAADRYPFRLLVRSRGAESGALFLVLRHPKDAGKFPCAILASGHRDTPAKAMEAAEMVAERIAVLRAAAIRSGHAQNYVNAKAVASIASPTISHAT